MKRTLRLTIVGLLLTGCFVSTPGCGGSSGGSSELRELVEAERAFARNSRERGIRSAFLAYLDEEAVIFRPGPVNGRDWYLAQPTTGALLEWEPVFADISAAGDLGYTTGPWVYSEEDGESAPLIFGEYVSVWRKTPSGQWRVAIDVGVTHARPQSPPAPLSTRADNPKRRGRHSTGDDERERSLLLSAERKLSEISETQGIGAAYAAFAAEDIRYYRPDAFAVLGIEAVRSVVVGGERVRFEPIAGVLSVSRELGYTYGMSVRGDGVDGDKAYYLRIWRRPRDSGWKIALDIAVPDTSPEEAGEAPDE